MALNPMTEDDASVQIEERYCVPSGVAGVTHKSNNTKTSIQATLEIPQVGFYQMDVTVVIANNAEGSEFYFTSYTVEGIEGDGSAVESGANTTGSGSTPGPIGSAPSPAPRPSSASVLMSSSGLCITASIAGVLSMIW